jgi:energy-coupling factor transporter transmembrane protein EcfT
MINQNSLHLERSKAEVPEKYGTISYIVIFLWSLGMVMLTQGKNLLLVGTVCLLVAFQVFPRSLRSLMRLRWLVMILILAVPPIFLLGDLDRSIWGAQYSSEGLESSLQILLRIIILLISVDGFTSSVDISTIAGLLERFGFKGLGFTLGVALNLLPSLKVAAINTWHSLWMRGGLRAQRWRGIRLLLLTIVTNALRRTEEIALAAEGRAYCPDQPHAPQLRAGTLDRTVIVTAFILTLGIFIVP